MWCMSGGTLLWWSCQPPVAYSYGLLNHRNSYHGGMFKLNTNFDGDLFLYLLSHFERDSHTVHVLTQWGLLPPLTSTVKLSLFMHAHSSMLSLAATLHWCHTNHFHCITNGWTFPSQTLYAQSFAPRKGLVHLQQLPCDLHALLVGGVPGMYILAPLSFDYVTCFGHWKNTVFSPTETFKAMLWCHPVSCSFPSALRMACVKRGCSFSLGPGTRRHVEQSHQSQRAATNRFVNRWDFGVV